MEIAGTTIFYSGKLKKILNSKTESCLCFIFFWLINQSSAMKHKLSINQSSAMKHKLSINQSSAMKHKLSINQSSAMKHKLSMKKKSPMNIKS